MDWPQRLVRIGKERGPTQQSLADPASAHVVQPRRYECGKSQPALDVLRRLAGTFAVSADLFFFDHEERGPDESMRLWFEAARCLNAGQRKALALIIEGNTLQRQHPESAQRLSDIS